MADPRDILVNRLDKAVTLDRLCRSEAEGPAWERLVRFLLGHIPLRTAEQLVEHYEKEMSDETHD